MKDQDKSVEEKGCSIAAPPVAFAPAGGRAMAVNSTSRPSGVLAATASRSISPARGSRFAVSTQERVRLCSGAGQGKAMAKPQMHWHRPFERTSRKMAEAVLRLREEVPRHLRRGIQHAASSALARRATEAYANCTLIFGACVPLPHPGGPSQRKVQRTKPSGCADWRSECLATSRLVHDDARR